MTKISKNPGFKVLRKVAMDKTPHLKGSITAYARLRAVVKRLTYEIVAGYEPVSTCLHRV